jgi:hypothetical protein
MKKAFGVAAIILVAFCVWYFSSKQTNTPQTEPVEEVSVDGVGVPEGKELTSGTDSLLGLSTQGKDLECQIRFEQGGTEDPIEGTFFTSQGKLRGDFIVPAPEFGGVVVSSMILDTDMLFVWSDINGEVLGFKSDRTTQDVSIKTKEPVPLETPVQYSCGEWSALDMSVFVPPATITFTDVEASLEEGMEYGTILSE